MIKRRMSEVLSLEYRVLLESLGRFEKALTRDSVISLQDIVRLFEEQLLLHRRREEEALFPAMARHLPGQGGPLAQRRFKSREQGERLKELRINILMGHRGKFLFQGQLFVTQLRDYLRGANDFLLPLAERLLSAQEWDQVRRNFDSIGSKSEPVAPEAVVSA